jgi:predicted ester cyclase
MSTDANKAVVVASIEEGCNTRRLSIFDELFGPDLVDHGVPPRLPSTLEGRKQLTRLYWSAFPDLRLTIEDQIAEGEKVVTRWTARGTNLGEFMGTPPTGRRVIVTGITIDRFVEGKIVERWAEIGQLGTLQNLRAISGLEMQGADATITPVQETWG